MLQLSGQQSKQLRKAILSAYPEPGGLEILVGDELDENLAAIAGGSNYTQKVFKLIQWAEAKGRLDDLVVALYEDTPDNPDLKRFCEPIHDYLQQHVLLSAVGSAPASDRVPFDWRGPSEDLELQSWLRTDPTWWDVGFLKRGLERASSVCRIEVPARDTTGTGVLIGDRLVLTNYHLFGDTGDEDREQLNAAAKTARLEFGCLTGANGQATNSAIASVDPQDLILKSSPIQQLDFVLIRLDAQQLDC